MAACSANDMAPAVCQVSSTAPLGCARAVMAAAAAVAAAAVGAALPPVAAAAARAMAARAGARCVGMSSSFVDAAESLGA